MNKLKAIEKFGKSTVGIRPEIFPAINSFIPVKKSRVFVQPRAKVKAVGGGDAHRVRTAHRQAGLVEVVSREAEICESIDHALATGGSIPGFLALQKTPSGGVKAIPVKGAPVVCASAIALARMIDRELVTTPDVLALLGLGGEVTGQVSRKTARKSGWVRVGGFDALGKIYL